jgi:thiol-disulfide isomerase/thioredoxin
MSAPRSCVRVKEVSAVARHLNPNRLRDASNRKGKSVKWAFANGGKLKWRLGAFGLGLLGSFLVFGFSLLVSEDLRLLYVVAAIVLFCGAIWIGRGSRRDWVSALLLYVPLASMFSFFVLRQLPFLWPHLLLWALAITLGFFLSAASQRPTAIICGVVGVLAVSAWYYADYIPDRMKHALNHFGDGAAPAFAFQPVSEGTVPTTVTPGKILIIDFFGTWCPPCIAELPEIERVRANLQSRSDIEFVVVGTNSGGDTPERLRAFGRRKHVTLPLAFDQGGKAHAAFGMSGFPGLVVIDRTGRVRLTREGYNSSETTFRTDLTRLLQSL